ncbi:nucleotidyltransferase substrate binding protein [Patescibacteria group bacterium]|nr:nucleotidyltransferase substrate binding protein [Patescibacteria group bacterium]MBU1663517.1 nucleotidyltransferase substrate binding protein [Patescibacteria group bacterium]MBU1933779.1 nucleotidyltransferase substrate binding protein [Patescibacteria group bacterium]MBU2007829.1 nucleotidyltransferase substrate binding protein [Patescibacteria group bacterium]MBU2233256.1 nucleotidyltransferase substrate binding protein [Patescibacteria group bacterium]
MDNTLNLKLKKFKKARITMKEALDKAENDLIRDSVIKRFEYTFELCWKTIKIFLNDKFGIDVFSPKECFRELRKNELISDEKIELLLEMTDDRNKIIHTYDEYFSDELYKKIKKDYYELFKMVYEILEKNQI